MDDRRGRSDLETVPPVITSLPGRRTSPLDIREPGRATAVRFESTQKRSIPMTQQSAGLPCPACRVDLVMSERNGVEIDYCPKCRGVWLDRGELDKILERAASEMPGRASGPAAAPRADRSFERHDSDEYPVYGQHGKGTHYKKRSFLH